MATQETHDLCKAKLASNTGLSLGLTCGAIAEVTKAVADKVATMANDPACKDVCEIHESYRSTEGIVAHAQAVIDASKMIKLTSLLHGDATPLRQAKPTPPAKTE